MQPSLALEEFFFGGLFTVRNARQLDNFDPCQSEVLGGVSRDLTGVVIPYSTITVEDRE
jgi:hypothetical protein